MRGAYPLVSSEAAGFAPSRLARVTSDSRSGFAGPTVARTAWKNMTDSITDVTIVTHKNEPNLSKNVRVQSESTADASKVVAAAAITEIPIV